MDAPQPSSPSTPWHTLNTQEVITSLASDPQGLTSQEAAQRLENYGLNQLPQAKTAGPVKRFLLQFHNLLIYVLLAAAATTALLGHWIDTGVIAAVVIVNALIGFIQEGKAEQAMHAIRDMLAPKASVVRDGKRKTIASEQLVPGDIVLLEAGDKVPADCRVLTAHSLAAQESMLTGESLAVEKNTSVVEEKAALGDRTCLLYSGTMVVTGQGQAIVVSTGANTEIGRISGLLSQVETLTTPLLAQMHVFAKWLTLFVVAAGALLLLYGALLAGYPFGEIFMVVVGLSVAAIPEGLPAVLTITLAIGVQTMAKRHAIVRRLPAIETLGAVSVICSDKTGTLTRNEMMVASLATADNIFDVDGEGYAPIGDISPSPLSSGDSLPLSLQQLGLACVLCNDASLLHKENQWQCEGDPMEGALLAVAGKLGYELHDTRRHWQRTDAIPFDARYRFMATLNHNHEGAAGIFLKGAPEQVLDMCHAQLSASGETETLDKDHWLQAVEKIAAKGQRVLALAWRDCAVTQMTLEHAELRENLIFLGLVGMIDPPRAEAIQAVAECHHAGISVKMITGDHAKTASAIAQQIGLGNTQRVLTGTDIDTLDDTALRQAVSECDVFARTSPEHKLRLVTALQAQGLTVAMTGDGVNDAPALKRADAGIAMGQKGSEAAKEAADLVLADDNFASIVAAVHAGRTVYDNLSKVISFMLPVNGGEAISLVLALLLGLALPISPTQILWVNMIGSVVLAVTLAFEPAEANVMRRPPRNPATPIISGFLLWRVLFVSALFASGIFVQFNLAIAGGADEALARTVAVNTLVAMEVFYLFSIRYSQGTSISWRGVLGTPSVLVALVGVTVAQLIFTYLPAAQRVFETRSLSLGDLLGIGATGIVVLLIIEIEKYIRLKVVKGA